MPPATYDSASLTMPTAALGTLCFFIYTPVSVYVQITCYIVLQRLMLHCECLNSHLHVLVRLKHAPNIPMSFCDLSMSFVCLCLRASHPPPYCLWELDVSLGLCICLCCTYLSDTLIHDFESSSDRQGEGELVCSRCQR